MAASLEARVGPLTLASPAMLASGILGISTGVFRRLVDAGAGAVVTKSLSAEAWEGYANPTVIGAAGGGWLNAVGLSNPGAAEFARMLRAAPGLPAIVSLVGSEPADFARMVAEFGGCGVLAYELNLSCPHVARVGLEVGDDAPLVESVVRATRDASAAPVIAKVGLGSANYLDTVAAAIAGGASAITAINTVRAMAIDAEAARPVLSNAFGGLSGAPIKPVALRCVYEIASRHDIPVIGCGGVSTWEDAVEFILAGACAVQVGSALAGGNMGAFAGINEGILRYMERKGHESVQGMVGLARG